MKIYINKQILSDFFNLKNKVFSPLSQFCNEKETISISPDSVIGIILFWL